MSPILKGSLRGTAPVLDPTILYLGRILSQSCFVVSLPRRQSSGGAE